MPDRSAGDRERARLRTAEAARILALLAATLWLVHPYFTPRLIGTSDALWYHNCLADTVTQFRAGIFPVFVGQSDYSFNGSIYPLRAAPYHQYMAGVLDLLSGRTLGFFALQHLTVILSFLGGAFVTYGALLWTAPRRRWTAFALALLYVMCPGVAGLFYAQDLYMSGMTLPWVPLVFAATVRSFDEERLFPLAVLASALAALWWAHSPIALWTTAIVGTVQAARVLLLRPRAGALFRAAQAAAIFAVLAVYPIASVLLLRPPGQPIVPFTMDRELLLRWVAQSFPSSVEPIDLGWPILNYMQLGYALWAALLACVLAWPRRPRPAAVALLLAGAAVLLVLIFPVPGVTRFLWHEVPETVVGITLYWPLQRFYIIIAAITVVSFQRLAAEWPLERGSPRAAACAALAVSLAWSACEISKLIRKTYAQIDTVADSRLWTLPENVAIQRHSYGLFPARPAYYSHGVVDPRMESRLLDPTSGQVVASDYTPPGTSDPFEDFHGTIDANPGILDLDPPLSLSPGRKYLLTFAFARPDTTGILQMTGPAFRREYLLPASGDAKAFGSGAGNERSITVWTSGTSEEAVRLRFIPTAPGARPTDYMEFARYRMLPIDEATLPIRIASLIPYTADVTSARPALLETPRMSIPGYSATVNGMPVPVGRSLEGLVEIPVPAGNSRVVLLFPGTVALRVAFWVNALGWVGTAAVASFILVGLRGRRGTPVGIDSNPLPVR